MVGTVCKVVVDKGFGFIRPADGQSPDLFFFHRQCMGVDFNEQLLNRRVEFDVENADRGPRAINVRPKGR